MTLKKSCMFCGSVVEGTRPVGGMIEIVCTICNRYRVSKELIDDGPNVGKGGYLVSAWLRWHALENKKSEPPQLTHARIQEIVKEAPSYRPLEKADKLLVAIARITKRPGMFCKLTNAQAVPLAWARFEAEAAQYLSWLADDGLIVTGDAGHSLRRAGWARYEELLSNGRATSRRAFVAMWFSDEMDNVWEKGIRPGVEAAGFEPYRVKGQPRSDRIDAHIIAELRACRFVVADVTGERTAVYYEAGFAEGLNKRVIWTCDKTREHLMSFDTRQFPHILWKDADDLRVQLVERIKAVIF
jgi:hypothetical protein